MGRFNREISRYRYLDSPYVFYVQTYRDGWSISIEDEVAGKIWKLYCDRTEHMGEPPVGAYEASVLWKVAGVGAAELPGTGRYISDLVREFLNIWEQGSTSPGARVGVLFG